MGPSSQVSKKNSSAKYNPPQNLRTTSHGTAFKKVTQHSKSGVHSRDDSPLYHDDGELIDMGQFENTDRLAEGKMHAKRGSVDYLMGGDDENINMI